MLEIAHAEHTAKTSVLTSCNRLVINKPISCRLRSHGLRQLVDDKCVASYQFVIHRLATSVSTSSNKSANDNLQQVYNVFGSFLEFSCVAMYAKAQKTCQASRDIVKISMNTE